MPRKHSGLTGYLGVRSRKAGISRHHVSRSDRLLWGNHLVAGLGSQFPLIPTYSHIKRGGEGGADAFRPQIWTFQNRAENGKPGAENPSAAQLVETRGSKKMGSKTRFRAVFTARCDLAGPGIGTVNTDKHR